MSCSASERQAGDDVAAAELSAVLGDCKFKTPKAETLFKGSTDDLRPLHAPFVNPDFDRWEV
jgi:hypothetical protein